VNLALALGCAVGCALVLACEARGARRLVRGLCKGGASACFVVLGVRLWTGDAYGTWILAGLALGAVGDVLLVGEGKAAFAAGLGAFLLGHLAYVAGIATLVPVGAWPSPLAALPAIAGAVALAWLWPHLGSLRVPVIAYVAAIVAMVVGALAARDRPHLAVGAALFFASDLSVARDRFVAPGLANRAWGLPAYYAGQLLIAWSIAAAA
jgi:uncharacterized membrane protein YhhN